MCESQRGATHEQHGIRSSGLSFESKGKCMGAQSIDRIQYELPSCYKNTSQNLSVQQFTKKSEQVVSPKAQWTEQLELAEVLPPAM
jgi:hypothetical protein